VIETAAENRLAVASEQLDELESRIGSSGDGAGAVEHQFLDAATGLVDGTTVSRDGTTVTASHTAAPAEFAGTALVGLSAVTDVLVNTADFLQSSAESTGQQSSFSRATRRRFRPCTACGRRC